MYEEFLDKKNVIAVVGSLNPEKFGVRIYNDLKSNGYQVYLVNPEAEKYKSLRDCAHVDIVDLVLPPKATMGIAKKAKELGINKLWFQPGAEDTYTIKWAEENGMKFVYGACIMVESK